MWWVVSNPNIREAKAGGSEVETVEGYMDGRKGKDRKIHED